MPSLIFDKVAGLRSATLLKKRLWHRCFAVNFAKFLRTPFLTEHLCWLLLCYLQSFNFQSSIVRMCPSKGILIYCIYIDNDNLSFFSIKSSIVSDCTTNWLSHPHVFYCIVCSVYVENKCIYKSMAYINKANVNQITKLNKIATVIYFEWVFLTPLIKRPPSNRSTNHRPPTKCTDHRSTDHWPITNMTTRNFMTNFRLISDKEDKRSYYKYGIENVSNFF